MAFSNSRFNKNDDDDDDDDDSGLSQNEECEIGLIVDSVLARYKTNNIDWEAKEIAITNEAQLREFSLLVNNGKDFAGQTLMLDNDLDLEDEEWIPIGIHSGHIREEDEEVYLPFSGTFDGNLNTINGVYVGDERDKQALFGCVGKYGIIKNLIVSVDIKGETSEKMEYGNYSGSIAGDSYGLIQNCTVIGMVEGVIAGGLIGCNYGIINFCISYVEVKHKSKSSNNDAAGGLVGKNFGNVYDSFALGSTKGKYNVGGLVGANLTGATIKNSSAKGDVNGENDIGGLTGVNYGKIKNCSAKGNVYGAPTSSFRGTGGLVGTNYGKITQCCLKGDAAELDLVGKNEGEIVD